MNVDLCFVPATPPETEAMPAVSGSSGRLIVSPPKKAQAERTWPGRVFEQADRSYREAMDGFIAAREATAASPTPGPSVEADPEAKRHAERRALTREVERLRTERRAEREWRRAAAPAWRAQKQAQRARVRALGESEAPEQSEQTAKRAALKA